MNVTTDEIDRAILRALREDGRMSLVHLADRVGLSPTPCKRRVQRLEESGIISSYVARIDRKAAGYDITVFVSVELERQDAEEVNRFQTEVARFEEVVTGTLITGGQDFLLEVVVGSLEEFETFLQTRLLKIKGIRAVRSRFALKKFIERARLP
ncbi:MAG: Lrp/AsnC family transcriptional regulator [Pseudomonadota bacterium]